ncbi:TPA: hypothetical protein M5853_001567 [Klebsiella aerogenes]|uniref:hypothetical protein n=1 Tax=Klebsiella aerogenes TaxID=548 RepID=UPI00388E2832|nr:hypothetical protein [Klebsiella aerogenes]HCM6140055.1 hypothetical protein [Klebsiella aerogenes]
MPTYGKIKTTGVEHSVVVPSTSTSIFHEIDVERGKTAVIEYTSEEVVHALMKTTQSHEKELAELRLLLTEKQLDTKEKESIIKESKIFEYLSAASNAATALTFLVSLF